MHYECSLLKIDVFEMACLWKKMQKQFQEVFSPELVSGFWQVESIQDVFKVFKSKILLRRFRMSKNLSKGDKNEKS